MSTNKIDQSTQKSKTFEEKCKQYLENHSWMKEYPGIEAFLHIRFSYGGFYTVDDEYSGVRIQRCADYQSALSDLESQIDTKDRWVLNAIIITLNFVNKNRIDCLWYAHGLNIILKWRIEQLKPQNWWGKELVKQVWITTWNIIWK
jgi:hypothetical protein